MRSCVGVPLLGKEEKMKKVTIGILSVFLLSFMIGCQNTKTHAVEGSLAGGLLGATAGGIIGHQSGRGLEGAGIGAAVGALGGGLIGGQMEKDPASSTRKITMGDVIELTKMGFSDSDIIQRIKDTDSTFDLSTSDIKYLREEGVNQIVIDAMQGRI